MRNWENLDTTLEIIACAIKNPITTQTLMDKFNMCHRTANRYLTNLERLGYLSFSGFAPSRAYTYAATTKIHKFIHSNEHLNK